MKNVIGDRAIVDTAKMGEDYIFVEMDGLHFDSTEYPDCVSFFQAIADRARLVSLGKCN